MIFAHFNCERQDCTSTLKCATSAGLIWGADRLVHNHASQIGNSKAQLLGDGYTPAKVVVGLWAARVDIIRDIFESRLFFYKRRSRSRVAIWDLIMNIVEENSQSSIRSPLGLMETLMIYCNSLSTPVMIRFPSVTIYSRYNLNFVHQR